MNALTRRWSHASILAGAVLAGAILSVSRAAAETLWIRAADAQSLSGPIVLGAKTGIVEEDALGDFLVSTVRVTADKLTGGYAQYAVKIPKTATYYIWARLRYPHGIDESFAVIPGSEKPTTDMSRCLGMSGVGVDKWHWDSQGRGAESRPGSGRLSLNLDAGDATLRVYAREASASVYQPLGWRMGRPMFNPRLNVLCLTTDPAYVPTDADARRALDLKPTHFNAEEFHVKPAALPVVTPEEWRLAGKKQIPDWLRCPRFYTKDAWRAELAHRKPGDIAYIVRQVAANEGTAIRLAACYFGDAYFQSKVTPHAPGLGSLDYLREAIDEGRRLGVKIVMYMNPCGLYASHPLCLEAAIRGPGGNVLPLGGEDAPDCHLACINNPAFRDLVARVLTEVFSEYGPDGLYLDGGGPYRCFCPHCREKFRRMFGHEMPVEKLAHIPERDIWVWEMVSQPEPVGDPNDLDCQQYTAFLDRSAADMFQLVAETVKRCKPDAVTLFHTHAKPSTAAYYDGTLTEIYLEHPWKHRLWKSGEMASYSNVFPVPVLFNIYLHAHGTEAEARLHTFQGLANGCYPNFWNLLEMKPAFRFLRENAECFDFARTAPVKYIAFPRGVHEDVAQAALSKAGDAAKGPTDRFLGPYVGLYSALVRRGLPVVTLHRGDFHKRLDGFKVLCLANEACMSAEKVEAVRQFVQAGGGLIATHETSLYDEKGKRRDDFGLADVFGAHYVEMLPAAAREVRIDIGHEVTQELPNVESRNRPGVWRDDGARLQEASGPSWIHNEPCVLVRLDGSDSLATFHGTEAGAKAAPAIVIHRYGAGRVVYLPGRFEAVQMDRPSYHTQQLLANAVQYVGRHTLPVEVRAAAPVEATLFDQPERRILHLVNLNGDSLYRFDKIEPIQNVAIRLQIPAGRHVARLRRLWDRADVPFQVDGDHVLCVLKQLGDYEALVAELAQPK